MASKDQGADKTGRPTPKRIRDARKEGNVSKSRELTATVLTLGLAACGDDDSAGPDDSDHLVVGALLSLTGPGQTLGQTSEAALHLAADDVNARLIDEGSPTRVSLRIEDTGLDPALALIILAPPLAAARPPR